MFLQSSNGNVFFLLEFVEGITYWGRFKKRAESQVEDRSRRNKSNTRYMCTARSNEPIASVIDMCFSAVEIRFRSLALIYHPIFECEAFQSETKFTQQPTAGASDARWVLSILAMPAWGQSKSWIVDGSRDKQPSNYPQCEPHVPLFQLSWYHNARFEIFPR